MPCAAHPPPCWHRPRAGLGEGEGLGGGDQGAGGCPVGPGRVGARWPYLSAPPAPPCRTPPRPGSWLCRCRPRCQALQRPAPPGSTRCPRRRSSGGCSPPAAPRPGGTAGIRGAPAAPHQLPTPARMQHPAPVGVAQSQSPCLGTPRQRRGAGSVGLGVGGRWWVPPHLVPHDVRQRLPLHHHGEARRLPFLSIDVLHDGLKARRLCREMGRGAPWRSASPLPRARGAGGH